MFGTPYCQNATKAMLLGCGELGKEVCLELQRFGVEVIAVDRYPNAPAMQVAHRSHVIDMLDGEKLEALLKRKNLTTSSLKSKLSLLKSSLNLKRRVLK